MKPEAAGAVATVLCTIGAHPSEAIPLFLELQENLGFEMAVDAVRLLLA